VRERFLLYLAVELGGEIETSTTPVVFLILLILYHVFTICQPYRVEVNCLSVLAYTCFVAVRWRLIAPSIS